MKILLATKNKNKIKEIKEILKVFNKDKTTDIITLNELDDNDVVYENENTFEGNALLKAKYYYEKYHIPTLSDDSGLVVPSLNNEPGVLSARYANGNDDDNINKLLFNLKGNTDRDAYFECVLCFYDGSPLFFCGRSLGQIGYEKKGSNGFGYDPIFIVDGKSFADMSSESKNKISHRVKALKLFIEKIL